MVASDHGGSADPTVCDAASRAKIQALYGVNIEDVDPRALEFVVEQSRKAGNEAFKGRQYKEAIQLYSQAIAGAERDAPLFSNRSAAYLAEGSFDRALWDAQKCVALRPDWGKARYRLGCAALGLCDWAAARDAFVAGLELCPGDKDMTARLQEAEWVLDRRSQLRAAQAAVDRRAVVARLRELRARSARDAALRQFKQSMAGPEWDLEDLDWRPTFMPGMLTAPRSELEAMAGNSLPLVQAYLSQLADLAAPKAALAAVGDAGRWEAYAEALRMLVGRAEAPAMHALVLEAGGGVLGPLASRAGAGMRVTCVPRGRMLYRMARQVAHANEPLDDLKISPCALRGVRVGSGVDGTKGLAAEDGQHPSQEGHTAAHPSAEDDSVIDNQMNPGSDGTHGRGNSAAPLAPDMPADGWDMGPPADLLITDMLDHGVLGLGLLPAIDDAAARLLAPGAVVMPQRIKVYGQLVEVTPAAAEGLDLSPLEAYRWWPGPEAVAERELPLHVALSAPFPVSTLDLQARVDRALAGAREGEGSRPMPASPADPSAWEEDNKLEIHVTRTGRATAVLYWWDAELTKDAEPEKHVVLGNGTGIAPAVGDGLPPHGQRRRWRSNMPMALHYLDAAPVTAGSCLSLRVRQDCGRYVFEASQGSSTSIPGRPRHALVPRWHFDMIRDATRNAAYAAAIGRAVQTLATRGGGVHVLDAGAGTGLLGLLAARAGATSVVGLELNRHMCDVADECLAANGALGRVTVLDRDARRARAEPGPDGAPADLDRRVDLVVYEVFDSGLIGEGVLHILTAVMRNLAARGARLVPASARVFAQAIQLRSEAVMGLDVRPVNRWRWRPDYEGINLEQCRDDWVALCDPVEIFRFDFYDTEINMHPATETHDLHFTEDPVWKQAFDTLQPLNSQLVRACVQNPLEYRGVALAAVALAARPHVFGVDAGQAVEFCRKMMG